MMWFSLIIGLLFMIIPLAYLLASVVGLSYLWYRVLKVKRGGDLPTCAGCGYAVRGLAGLECPECGADLREVGITTPKQRGVVSPVLFVLMWTLLLPGPSCLVSGLLSAVGPKTTVSIIDSLELNSPPSGEYQYININAFNGGTLGGIGPTTLMVQGNAQQYEDIQIDPVAMTYEDYTNFTYNQQNTTPPTKPLDKQAVLDLFQRAGADITKQDVIDEADEVLVIIQAMPTQGLGGVTSTRFSVNHTPSSYDQPSVWFLLLLLAVWIAVWVWGLVLFFRIRGKQLPEATHPRTDPARFAHSDGMGGAGGPPTTFG